MRVVISKFKDNSDIYNVQRELEQLIDAFKKCKRSKFKTESMKTLMAIKKEVDKNVKKEWKEFVGKDQKLVPCSSCDGKGYNFKYVGISCGDAMNASPYTNIRCTNCNGDGQILTRKVKA